MKRCLSLAALAVVAFSLVGCTTHISGTVIDSRTRRPFSGAILTVGNPAGVGVFERHVTDGAGKFDFYIAPTDEPYVYVYDGSDATTAQRIERGQLHEHMTVYIGGHGMD